MHPETSAFKSTRPSESGDLAQSSTGNSNSDSTLMRTQRMSQQPEFTTPTLPASPPPSPGQEPQRIPRWLVRGELFLRVLLRMYVGLAVCVVPWWPVFWDKNPLFLHYPTLGSFAAHGAVRGIISGVGLLNLWVAFEDAIRHRDG